MRKLMLLLALIFFSGCGTIIIKEVSVPIKQDRCIKGCKSRCEKQLSECYVCDECNNCYKAICE